MSFREKRAWISLISTLLVFGYYYYRLFSHEFSGAGNLHGIANTFLFSVGILVLLELGLNGILVLLLPRSERLPKDEREQLIEYRATKLAYYVLCTLTAIGAVFVVHNGRHTDWFAGNIVLSAVLTAMLVKIAVQIVYYRRGA